MPNPKPLDLTLYPHEQKRLREELTEEVYTLYVNGKLNPIDALFVCRLPWNKQMTAAIKCMRDFNLTMSEMDNPKSPLCPH